MRKFLSLLVVMMLFTIISFAQTKIVSGKITDAQGQPIPFSSVRIKNSKIGASADADGNYSIKGKEGDVIIVSGAGITAKEATITGASSLNVSVVRNGANLSEVVVTALGVQRQAKELGYSTAKISTDELTQAKVTNVGAGLAGKFLVCKLIW